jgi:hypothetical protein
MEDASSPSCTCKGELKSHREGQIIDVQQERKLAAVVDQVFFYESPDSVNAMKIVLLVLDLIGAEEALGSVSFIAESTRPSSSMSVKSEYISDDDADDATDWKVLPALDCQSQERSNLASVSTNGGSLEADRSDASLTHGHVQIPQRFSGNRFRFVLSCSESTKP